MMQNIIMVMKILRPDIQILLIILSLRGGEALQPEMMFRICSIAPKHKIIIANFEIDEDNFLPMRKDLFLEKRRGEYSILGSEGMDIATELRCMNEFPLDEDLVKRCYGLYKLAADYEMAKNEWVIPNGF